MIQLDLFNDQTVLSWSFLQEGVMRAILKLYVPAGRFCADVTFGGGGIWKNLPAPEHKFDKAPRMAGVEQALFSDLPLADCSLQSLMIDPPFLDHTGKTPGKHQEKYGAYESPAQLISSYQGAIREAFRVLQGGGVFVFKCQDQVYGRQYKPYHIIAVFNPAVEAGFVPLDTFVLCDRSRATSYRGEQRHSRSAHCYFMVFRKPIRRRK